MNKVRLWWHLNEGKPNFGDILNPWLVEKISNRKPVRIEFSRFNFRKVYIVIGSVLAIVRRNCVVWGAGIIKSDERVGPAKFLAVRGPQTRKRLLAQGHDCPEVYGDPAILLPKYYNSGLGKKYKLGIIPHYVDYESVYKKHSNADTKVINLIDPDVENVINQILECDNTVSSSLHGLIVSHAYKIPSVWVKFSEKLYGDDIKFQDYFESVGIKTYSPWDPSVLDDTNLLVTKIDHVTDINSIQLDWEDICNNLLDHCPFYNRQVNE